MNGWDLIGQDIFVSIAKLAASNKFELKRSFEELERLVRTNPLVKTKR